MHPFTYLRLTRKI